jgi:hypothetical protein
MAAELVEATRSEPIRAPSLEADFLVPLAVSLTSGILAGLLSWGLAFGSPLIVALVITGLVWGACIVGSRRLLYLTEKWSGKDLDKNGTVGEPTEWRIAITEKDEKGQPKKMGIFYPPPGVGEQEFTGYMRAVLSGGGMGYDRWTGKDGAFSRSQYDHILKELRRLGLCRNYGGSRGHELSAKGQATFRGLLLSKG